MNFFLSIPEKAPDGMCWVLNDENDACCAGLEEAIKNRLRIVPCSFCENPAVELDHFYPFFSDFNRCQECLDKEKRATALVKAPTMALMCQEAL